MRYKIADCITEYEPHYEMLRQKMESYRFEGEGEAEISVAYEIILRREAERAVTSHRSTV